MTYSFEIRGVFFKKNRTFPDLNDLLHAYARHPQAGAKMKKEYQMIASNAIRLQLGKVRLDMPVRIHYRLYEADRRRDPSNCAAFAVKVIEDALQDCGVLPNDGWKNIAGYSQDYYIDKDNPRIEVSLTQDGNTE